MAKSLDEAIAAFNAFAQDFKDKGITGVNISMIAGRHSRKVRGFDQAKHSGNLSLSIVD